jgi:toxin ParE1/3/4
VPRLVYLTSALRELAKISGDIEDASQSREVAITFIDKLTDYCERLARLPGLLGRARHELRSEYRSTTFSSYVIFFRYLDAATPREVMEIIHILHGARDIEAFFHPNYGDG